MTLVNIQNPMVLTFGVLGNIVAFLVYLAPAPTFYRIFKKKSTEGFQSVPYVVALFSCMIWIYYALVKSNETLLITINSVGCFIEALYISIYIAYASRKAKIMALQLLLLLNFLGFGLILVLIHFLVEESQRVQVLGWISVALSATVYIAPLSIMKQVIRTKSVEFMPISLSFALLLNSVMWFFYGLLLKDFYVTVPNIVGFIFGAVQITIYVIYKNCIKVDGDQDKLATNCVMPQSILITTTPHDQIHPVCSLPIQDNHDQNLEITITTSSAEENGSVVVEPKQRMVDVNEPNQV